MEKAILTLPMMPVVDNNYSKFVSPIVCEALSKKLNGKYYQCVNLLDSFKDRNQFLSDYLSLFRENKILYDELWIDKDNIDNLLENIYRLILGGYITELNTKVYRCSCGVIEIEENKVASCNQQKLKFERNNNGITCKKCKSLCGLYDEKILAFIPHKIKREEIIFVPTYLNNDAKTYDNTVLNSYVTISRKRDTGIKICYNGTYYNIDIDFLWATYLSLFPEKEKIVVSSNRMVYQLFLVGLIEKILAPDNKTILIGTPYLINVNELIENENFLNDMIFRKLVILLSLKWSCKEKTCDESTLLFLKKMYYKRRMELYNILTSESITANSYKDIEHILMKDMNGQECIRKLKRREKNV